MWCAVLQTACLAREDPKALKRTLLQRSGCTRTLLLSTRVCSRWGAALRLSCGVSHVDVGNRFFCVGSIAAPPSCPLPAPLVFLTRRPVHTTSSRGESSCAVGCSCPHREGHAAPGTGGGVLGESLGSVACRRLCVLAGLQVACCPSAPCRVARAEVWAPSAVVRVSGCVCQTYNSFGGGDGDSMDNVKFAKLARDAGLISAAVTKSDIDVIFTKVKVSSGCKANAS
jgi:hypothetical protein